MKCFSWMVRLLLLSLSLTAGQALANITYTFSGATFSDGGTLTGNFTTNDPRTSLLDYNITTSAGAGGIGLNYTTANSESTPTALPFILVLDSPNVASAANILQVTFANLTPTGSLITLGTFSSFEQHAQGNARRDITAGSVIVAAAIPEPETYGMMLAGLGLLGFVARRRINKVA